MVVLQRTAPVYRSVAAALTLGSIMALLLVGSVERSSTPASSTSAGIELVAKQMLEDAAYKWKGQKPEVNVFDDYDQDFQEGKWKDYKEPSNVFDDLPELENADHKWEANVLNDENVFNEIPDDRYPFNPTANGHEWKKWDSEEGIKEMNVFDHGQGLAAINLGEHAVTDADGNGVPFKCRDANSEDGANPCPEKNVLAGIVDPELSKFPIDTKEGTPEWGRTVASLGEDKNVFDTVEFPDSR